MSEPQIVIDTNVLVSALRSRQGASFRLISLVGIGKFEINLSVPLVLEYEAVAKRQLTSTSLTSSDIDDFVDYLCHVGRRRRIFFLWRPFLPDLKDDMVLELAVEANCQFIVTFNQKHFLGTDAFGIQALTPQAFLKLIGEVS